MNLKTILTLVSLFFFLQNSSFAQTDQTQSLVLEGIYRIKLIDRTSISGSVLEIKPQHVLLVKEGDTLRIPRTQIQDIRKVKDQPTQKESSIALENGANSEALKDYPPNYSFNINGFGEDSPSLLKSNLLIDNQIDISTKGGNKLSFQLSPFPDPSLFQNISILSDLSVFLASRFTKNFKSKKAVHPYLSFEFAGYNGTDNLQSKIYGGIFGGLTIGNPQYFLNTSIGPVYSFRERALSGFKIHTDFHISLNERLFIFGEHKTSPYDIIGLSNCIGLGFSTMRFTGQLGLLNIQSTANNELPAALSSGFLPSARIIKPL